MANAKRLPLSKVYFRKGVSEEKNLLSWEKFLSAWKAASRGSKKTSDL